MSHLTASEIVDSLDGALPPERQAHTQGCERCQSELQRAAAALEEVRQIDAPEPSPLFGDAFAGRVLDAIASERPRGVLPRWIWAPVTVVLLVAIATGVAVLRMQTRQPGQTAPTTTSGVAAAGDPTLDATTAEWTFITDVADDPEWDPADVPGLDLPPGSADHAVLQLSDDQRQELARLLRSEIDRNSS